MPYLLSLRQYLEKVFLIQMLKPYLWFVFIYIEGVGAPV